MVVTVTAKSKEYRHLMVSLTCGIQRNKTKVNSNQTNNHKNL